MTNVVGHRFQSDESPLDLHPVAGRIGVEVRGVRLAGALDAATVAAIRAALLGDRSVGIDGRTSHALRVTPVAHAAE